MSHLNEFDALGRFLFEWIGRARRFKGGPCCQLLQGLALVLVCSLGALPARAQACWPTEPEAQAAAVEPQQSPAPGLTSIEVYLDASGSMRGFARPGAGSAGENPFIDMNRALRDLASTASTRFFKYGDEVVQVSVDEFADGQDWEFYDSARYPQPNPDFVNHSRTELAVREVANQSDGALTIVITDLFLTGDRSGEMGALAGPLRDALRRGRAVGVMGVMAGFDDRVYDLPPNDASFPHDGLRPFFVMFIGHPENVSRVMAHFADDVSRVAQEVETALFGEPPPPASVPYLGDFAERGEVEAGRGVGVYGRLAVGVPVNQQYYFTPDNEGLIWQIDIGDLPSSSDIALSFDTELWRRIANPVRPDVSCSEAWRSLDLGDDFVQARRDGRMLTVTVNGGRSGPGALPDETVYALQTTFSGRMETRSTASSTVPGWMREWSASDNRLLEIQRTGLRDPFFPTWNLSELGNALASVGPSGRTQEASGPVGYLRFVFEVR